MMQNVGSMAYKRGAASHFGHSEVFPKDGGPHLTHHYFEAEFLTISHPTIVQKHTIAQSGRGRLGICPGVRIASSGSYVPEQIITNADLESLGCDSDWIVQRTGIRERRKALPTQATSDLATEAALRCLQNAAVDPTDVDLVICGTMTPDHATPSTACIIQKRLRCIAPAFDVGAACAGFMYALITGAQYVRSGMARNALIVGAEVMTRTVDDRDKKTYPLFGDGAGAVLLQPIANGEEESGTGLLSFTLGSEGDLEALCIPGGGSREPWCEATYLNRRQYLHMDGRSVFKWAVRIVEDSTNDVLSASGLSVSDIDLAIFHQANVRIIDAAMTRFEIPKEKVFVNLDLYGNTSAASIPLALDNANRRGLLSRGDLVLLNGFGAGLSWGTALLRW